MFLNLWIHYMSFNILVTGSKGQLGSEIHALSMLPHYAEVGMEFIFSDRVTLDITHKSSVENFCDLHKINVIINCAAYTAVDKAEIEVDIANLVNCDAVRNLAKIAKQRNISLIHISTDYVFDGTSYKPYVETDEANPQGIYGKTKLAGENVFIEVNPERSIIIRTSWVYSSFGNNFVKTMLRLGKEREGINVIFDQVGSPTYARDLAEAILFILPKLDNKTVETYHYSNEGVASWYDFSQAIFELADVDCKVTAIEAKRYPAPAKRPQYSFLNKSKIKIREM